MCNKPIKPPKFAAKEERKERKAKRIAFAINNHLIDIIEREVIKPTPNVSLLAGLVAELMPGTMPGRLLDAISKEYSNATKVAKYNSEKLESVMNELRPMAASFTGKLAEAMGLVESLSNAPHFAYKSPCVYPNSGMHNATNEEAGSYSTEPRFDEPVNPLTHPEEFAARIRKAAESARPAFEELGRKMREGLLQFQKDSPELMAELERMEPRRPAHPFMPELGGEYVLPWCARFPAGVSRIVGPIHYGKGGPAVEVKETQPGFVHGTRSETHNPNWFEENYGPFANHARKLKAGTALNGEELYFILQNRNTKYADAIFKEMESFGRDKYGPIGPNVNP